ncbi:hypothetical protein V2J09_007026 [Rumex salicifolius]
MGCEMSVFFVGISLLLHCISSASASAGKIIRPNFNYSNPATWGKLSAQCSNGKSQSPINIVPAQTVSDPSLGPLETFYHLQNASLLCNGASVQVAAQGKTELVIAGKTYKFIQMHWHSPSEHLINGIRFPVELHQVHIAEDGSVAVIKPYIEEIYHKIHTARGYDDAETPIPIANFRSMLIKDHPKTYYRYHGSFTTPPCSEVVTWTIVSKARTISRQQLGELKELLDKENKRNARPVQPLNGRLVHRFG